MLHPFIHNAIFSEDGLMSRTDGGSMTLLSDCDEINFLMLGKISTTNSIYSLCGLHTNLCH